MKDNETGSISRPGLEEFSPLSRTQPVPQGCGIEGPQSSLRGVWALRNVSFEVQEGESLGLVGNNGSGKSTLLKTLSGILVADRGSIATHGRLSSLLELEQDFILNFLVGKTFI